ncbi:MAG: LPXTG cell wall anchor domain-containing protein [Clostridiales bacterium]|nr:LPXTG cell wall anchor domain-containing protein [Clostridiales bacterium]
MKNLKKLTAAVLSVILALTMALSISVSSLAANDGKITITNATVGETYTIYKIFDATYTQSGTSYTITSGSDWYDLISKASVTVSGTSYDLFTLTDTGTQDTNGDEIYYVTTDYQSSVISWFQSLDTGIIPTYTATATATSDEVVFDNLEYGYYLVLSSLGTTVTLTSNTPTVEVIDKNHAPTMDTDTGKQIYDEDSGNWQTYNTEAVGNYVYYKLQFEATNYSGDDLVTQYIVSDNWESGLGDFDADSLVVVLSYENDSYISSTYDYAPDGTAIDTISYYYTTIGSSGYSISLNDATYSSNDNFVLTIPWVDTSYESIYPSPVTVTIYYRLKVQDGALAVVNYADGNLVNEMKAEYDVYNSSLRTRIGTSYAFTIVYNIGIVKIDGNTSADLEGAEFTLTDENGNVMYFMPDDNLAGVYHYDLSYTASTAGATSTLTTAANGRLVILGLDAGEYTLTETKASDGYNLIATATTITINGTVSNTLQATENANQLIIYYDSSTYEIIDNSAISTYAGTYSSTTYYGIEKTISNYTGTALPETGGMGTKIFYTLGGILVAAAGILLITKRRMTN